MSATYCTQGGRFFGEVALGGYCRVTPKNLAEIHPNAGEWEFLIIPTDDDVMEVPFTSSFVSICLFVIKNSLTV